MSKYEMEAICRMLACGSVQEVLASGEALYTFGRGFNSGRRSPYVTRQDRRLNFSSTALEFGKRRLSYFGPQLFYNHPGELREV